jgi:predicted transcriptional regulator
MINEVREIKEIRKKYGLTQAELAKIANVSQSLIAKIESNMIDPAYSKIKQIFEAINRLQHKKEMKAKDILNKSIIFLKSTDTLKEATLIMKKKGISQLPVIDPKQKEVVIGMISEAIILEAIMNKATPDSMISEIMTECPPIVAKDSEISMIGNLLKFYPMVIVKDKGKTIGIITKSDLLGKVYK